MISATALQKAALKFMVSQQESSGAFLGHASLEAGDFSQYRIHYTGFFTSLITSCLAMVPGTQHITREAASFISRQKSPEWSWNYWLPGSPDAKNRPYPDDLDDTACALSALYATDPSYVDGAALGYVAKLLISQESRPGGPYRTWLVNDNAADTWHDIDIAVNANIGFFLSGQQVHLAALEEYITSAIERSELESRYYIGTLPVIYFIARWYRGPALGNLKALVGAELSNLTPAAGPLAYALVIAAGCQLGLASALLASAVGELIAMAQDGDHWPAASLYYEPPIDGQLYYAGSAALTTAFAVEALHSYQKLGAGRLAGKSAKQRIAHRSLPVLNFRDLQPDLRLRYRAHVKQLMKGDLSGQITAIATITAEAVGKKVDASTLGHLNLASIHGWIAYTIYDDIIDEEGQIADLGLANVALRRTVHHFREALPAEAAFHQLVEASLDIIDGANTWEVTNARASLQDGRLFLPAWPKYGNRRQLAERSWGHILAARGVLTALGYAVNGTEQRQLQRFFRHYLIARQLNDDAHDWETDLQHGHITSVVADLLLGCYQAGTLDIDISADLEALKRHFWQHTIVGVAAQVKRHTGQARQALRASSFLADKSLLEAWLQNLEDAADNALAGRLEAQKFITSYAGEKHVR